MPTTEEILIYQKKKWLKEQGLTPNVREPDTPSTPAADLDRSTLYQQVKPLGWTRPWQESTVEEMKAFLDASSRG